MSAFLTGLVMILPSSPIVSSSRRFSGEASISGGHPVIEASCPKRTCVLVVQPWTLGVRDASLCKKLLSCIRKLKARGVLICYLSYANAVSEDFLGSSDIAFFMVSSNLAQGLGMSRSKARSICRNCHFLPIDYPALISLMDKELEKNSIDHLLITGGFREDCVPAVAKFMCASSRLKGLKIRLIEKLLISQRRLSTGLDMSERLAKYRKYHSCDISISKKDPGLLYLRYFK